jgi:sulfur-oxidizing protein SoxY
LQGEEQDMTRQSALLALALLAAPAAYADPLENARAERWQELRQAFFGDRIVAAAEAGEIAIDLPARALDGARVPVTIRLRDPRARGLTLIVDENPMPLAAHVAFGPGGDPQGFGLQIRVDRYTYVHVVAETDQGALRETARFVKAAGGCSGPPPAEGASATPIGHMSVRLGTGPVPEVGLAIKHPNCTGMQIDPVSRGYTPARFLRTMEVTHDGASVLRLETGISLAADPTISFRLAGPPRGELGVVARDSDEAVFEQALDLERQGS